MTRRLNTILSITAITLGIILSGCGKETAQIEPEINIEQTTEKHEPKTRILVELQEVKKPVFVTTDEAQETAETEEISNSSPIRYFVEDNTDYTYEEEFIEDTAEIIEEEQVYTEDIVEIVDDTDTEVYKEEIGELYSSLTNIINPDSLDYLMTDGNPSQEGINALYEEIKYVQPNVLQSFLSNFGFIVVADDETLMNILISEDPTVAAKNADYHIDGFHSANYHGDMFMGSYIYLSDSERAVKGSLSHELGHYIDEACGRLSHSIEFQNIYALESPNCGLYSYYTDSVGEYFAESYSQSWKHPEEYYSKCPLTYNFIMQYANSL